MKQRVAKGLLGQWSVVPQLLQAPTLWFKYRSMGKKVTQFPVHLFSTPKSIRSFEPLRGTLTSPRGPKRGNAKE